MSFRFCCRVGVLFGHVCVCMCVLVGWFGLWIRSWDCFFLFWLFYVFGDGLGLFVLSWFEFVFVCVFMVVCVVFFMLVSCVLW